VEMLQEGLGLSEWRACRIVRQYRSTQRHRPVGADPDAVLRARLRCFAADHPRWGYRRAHAVLVREGFRLNRKKVQRLWGEEGLRVPPKRRKRQRLGSSTTPADRLVPPTRTTCGPSTTSSTSPPPAASSSSSPSSTSSPGSRSPTSSTTPSTPTPPSLASRRSSEPAAPNRASSAATFNGPELTANALRDWCRFGGAGTSYIDPRSPWQNPWVESYASRMRDELLAIEQFAALFEAQVVVEAWRTEYG
jgi:putative transposase